MHWLNHLVQGLVLDCRALFLSPEKLVSPAASSKFSVWNIPYCIPPLSVQGDFFFFFFIAEGAHLKSMSTPSNDRQGRNCKPFWHVLPTGIEPMTHSGQKSDAITHPTNLYLQTCANSTFPTLIFFYNTWWNRLFQKVVFFWLKHVSRGKVEVSS